MLTCTHPTCNTILFGKQKKYCSTKCKHSMSNYIHQTYKNQKEKALNRKLQLIEMLGGKCSRCAYNKNIAALCFHHRDLGLTKEMALTARELSNTSWDIILNEVKKCDLVCTNCHMEIHHPTMELVGPLGLEPRT